MLEVFAYLVVALVAFGAGLHVGRRNPAVADTAASLANQAKTEAVAVKDAVVKK